MGLGAQKMYVCKYFFLEKPLGQKIHTLCIQLQSCFWKCIFFLQDKKEQATIFIDLKKSMKKKNPAKVYF